MLGEDAEMIETYTAVVDKHIASLIAMMQGRDEYDMYQAVVSSLYNELVVKRGLDPYEFRFSGHTPPTKLVMVAERLA